MYLGIRIRSGVAKAKKNSQLELLHSSDITWKDDDRPIFHLAGQPNHETKRDVGVLLSIQYALKPPETLPEKKIQPCELKLKIEEKLVDGASPPSVWSVTSTLGYVCSINKNLSCIQ